MYDQTSWSINKYKFLTNIYIWIKLYIFNYPLYGDLQSKTILGHVDFSWNPMDIVDTIIYHYLMSKSSKRIFIKINFWAQESHLEFFWINIQNVIKINWNKFNIFIFHVCIFIKSQIMGKFSKVWKPEYWKKEKL